MTTALHRAIIHHRININSPSYVADANKTDGQHYTERTLDNGNLLTITQTYKTTYGNDNSADRR